MSVQVTSVDQPSVQPLEMPDRFRHDITYFMTPGGEEGVPLLAKGEYWIRAADARRWLDELVVLVVSPLDSQSKAEIELTEEQEAWLEWLVENGIQHVRLA
jgi:hypothetical protein